MMAGGMLAKAALKAVVKALANPEETAKKIKKVTGVLIGVGLGLFLVPMLALSLPNLFGKGDSDFTMELDQIPMYQEIVTAYDTYQSGVQAQIQVRIEIMKAANKAKADAAKASKTNSIKQNNQLTTLLFKPSSLKKIQNLAKWEEGQLIGEFEITGYCACTKCCGEAAQGITSTGTKVKANWTIAVDPNTIPYGTHVKIQGVPGITFRAEDCGGAIKKNKIDRYFDTHEEAIKWGRKQNIKVYYVASSASKDPDGIGDEIEIETVGSSKANEIAYALAYISTQHVDKQIQSDNFKLDKTEVIDFYNTITSIDVWQIGIYPDETYDYKVTVLDVQEIAEKFFGKSKYPKDYDEKMQQFLFSYETYQDIVKSESEFTDFPIDFGDLVFSDVGMEIPLYLQTDSRWGSFSYGVGKRTIATSGCAPTSMAMVETYLTGNVVSPVKTAKWSFQNGYGNNGTAWGFFGAYSKTIGIQCVEIGVNATKIVESLNAGKPVVISMGPGIFTSEGHFIVLRGMTKEGLILVNDPNDSNSKNHFNKSFSLGKIIKEAKFPDGRIKSAWAFSK